MSLKLCEPKNILEKKDVLMLRHICYDNNGSTYQSINHLLRHNKGLQGLKINTLYITTQIYNTIIRHREARPIYL